MDHIVKQGNKEKKPPSRTRRAVLFGGLGIFAAAAVAGRDEIARGWWLLPGVAKPRKEGELDHVGASWTAASPANWRLADRPDDYRVDRIVVHVTQGGFQSSVDAFRNPWHKASAHYIVRGDGHVEQMVRELDVAFHSGNRSMNERSVGIEHVGFVDRPQDFTDAMYAASARLAADICRRYGTVRHTGGPHPHSRALRGPGRGPHGSGPPLGLGPVHTPGPRGARRNGTRRGQGLNRRPALPRPARP